MTARRNRRVAPVMFALALVISAGLAAPPCAAAQGKTVIDQLTYPKLNDIPVPTVVRETLPNGVKLLFVEDHEFPVVGLQALVRGGMLAEPAPQLRELIPGGAQTTASVALRFVLSNPDVSCACSGMNTLEMLKENVETASEFDGASDDDRARLQRVLDEFRAVGDKFCTACRYCMDCPNGVDIPCIFATYNFARVYGLTEWARKQYAAMDPAKRADACTRCGECEPKCPNKLPSMEQLEEADRALR